MLSKSAMKESFIMSKGIRINYQTTELKSVIEIENIISIHYFEYMSDFTFEGESHDFWEFLCVDKGTVNVIAGDTEHTLNHGDIIFHKPNEFHNVTANGVVAPNLVVIAFTCHSPAMTFFEQRILNISERERELFGLLIKEARNAFTNRLDNPYAAYLERNKESKFGSEQLIKMYLQILLIQLKRTYEKDVVKPILPKSTRQRSEQELFHNLVSYMEDHLQDHLTIEQICRDNLIGRALVQKLFHDYTDSGVIDYYSNMKITAAKQLIRNKKMNFTQISEELGYTSIHYFSRQFKAITGMTPSEYASSIKLLSENPDE